MPRGAITEAIARSWSYPSSNAVDVTPSGRVISERCTICPNSTASISTSRYSVLRGIHGDKSTWKLITCLYGAFYLIVVDNRKKSKNYKKWISFTLTSNNNKQILVPPGFGNGHQILTNEAIFHYKQNTFYDRSSQFTIKYNDPDYAFNWPIANPILSDRDK